MFDATNARECIAQKYEANVTRNLTTCCNGKDLVFRLFRVWNLKKKLEGTDQKGKVDSRFGLRRSTQQEQEQEEATTTMRG